MNNNHSEVCKKSHCQSQGQYRAGFAENLYSVFSQIEYTSFAPEVQPLAYELGMIIAEIYTLSENFKVRIGGAQLPAEMVSAVYQRLTKENIELVIEKFRGIDYEIKYRKSYFRTALYNSAFECESYWVNQVRKDGFV